MNRAAVLCGGLDLHGDNVFCSLLNENREVVFEKRFPNDLPTIRDELEPYRDQIRVLAVESTYNWYWLVDGLQRLDYQVKLANPAKMQENIGLKYANDKTDARFIARQLTMGVLPEGYIYPAETRGVCDLLRRRMRLVHARTSEWLSLGSLMARHTGGFLAPAFTDSRSVRSRRKAQTARTRWATPETDHKPTLRPEKD